MNSEKSSEEMDDIVKITARYQKKISELTSHHDAKTKSLTNYHNYKIALWKNKSKAYAKLIRDGDIDSIREIEASIKKEAYDTKSKVEDLLKRQKEAEQERKRLFEEGRFRTKIHNELPALSSKSKSYQALYKRYSKRAETLRSKYNALAIELMMKGE